MKKIEARALILSHTSKSVHHSLRSFHYSLKTYPQPLPMRTTSKDASSSSSGKLGGSAQLNDARSSTSAGDEDLSARPEGLRARQEA